jgi:hypothetical protein
MRIATATIIAATTLIAPGFARANNVNIFLSGMCSTSWVGAPGGAGGGSNGGSPSLGFWTGESSVDAAVDQRNSLSTAASQFKAILDANCPAGGANTCYIINYSAGDGVTGYVFANLAWSYKIGYIVTEAGAAGGSTLAGDIASKVACPFASGLTESSMRNAYNHQSGWNSNAGVHTLWYRMGGNKRLTASNVACVVGSVINTLTFGLVSGGTCLQSQNDGAVAFHSSGGYNTVGDYQTFWDGVQSNHWVDQRSYFYNPSTCTGSCTTDYLNHYNMKMFGVCMEGGIAGKSGWSQCQPWASTL